jgi:thiamine-monophosphate kinase
VTHSFQTSLANLGEFGFISRIAAKVGSPYGVITGIGDDAAVTALSPGMQLLTSTDMLLENVHFRLSWHEPYRLGRKSLAVSISDIAAMGGIPRWALLSLALPPDFSLDVVDEFMRGFLAMAEENRVVLIGGDTCTSRSGLTISVTIMGEQIPDRIIRRAGALPDDDIWVTGTLGDAALALALVESAGSGSAQPLGGNREITDILSARDSLSGVEGRDALLSRLLDPSPRVAVALALAEAGLANAMIDISDGVLADFGHIAGQSNVGGRLHPEDLPLSPAFRSQTALLSRSPLYLALSGGEDYELCFTSDRSNREKISQCVKKCGIAATRIGIVTSFSGVSVVSSDGAHYETPTRGFNHFA